ncbi:smooth muscle caldesmon [Planoprotostelium fungivorum]|uniref:Smooth muscle caldesmon n=1 Tax=Planoprotostelium fungivorum TaxID=1890364 RepID=A0A2P6NWA4_9EUKA|nr:smooth muscle caldesmon [Planoprotostelium fungivorum]
MGADRILLGSDELDQALELYGNNQSRIKSDIYNLTRNANNLRPSQDTFVSDDGQSYLLVLIGGTIPIRYEGATYNIPVDMWIPKNYPQGPPLCFVVGSRDLLIKKEHHSVDPNGRCHVSYTNQWRSDTCDLLGLMYSLTTAFSKDPPLYKRPGLPELNRGNYPDLHANNGMDRRSTIASHYNAPPVWNGYSPHPPPPNFPANFVQPSNVIQPPVIQPPAPPPNSIVQPPHIHSHYPHYPNHIAPVAAAPPTPMEGSPMKSLYPVITPPSVSYVQPPSQPPLVHRPSEILSPPRTHSTSLPPQTQWPAPVRHLDLNEHSECFYEKDEALQRALEESSREAFEREKFAREERERHEQMERQQRERQEWERQERERQEWERKERERQEWERKERERQERERQERERQEWERQERERYENQMRERQERERYEQMERERCERETQEKQERERQEREKHQRELHERQEKERIEKDRMEREKRKEATNMNEAPSIVQNPPLTVNHSGPYPQYNLDHQNHNDPKRQKSTIAHLDLTRDDPPSQNTFPLTHSLPLPPRVPEIRSIFSPQMIDIDRPHMTSLIDADDVQTNYSERARKSGNIITLPSPDINREDMCQRVTEKTAERVRFYNSHVTSEIERLEMDHHRLLDSEVQLRSGMQVLEDERNHLDLLIARIEEKEGRLDEFIQRAENLFIPIDEALTPSDALSAQIFDLAAEDAALEDALYILNQCFLDNKMDGDQFLKVHRKLCREQFMAKATIQKVYALQRG